MLIWNDHAPTVDISAPVRATHLVKFSTYKFKQSIAQNNTLYLFNYYS